MTGPPTFHDPVECRPFRTLENAHGLGDDVLQFVLAERRQANRPHDVGVGPSGFQQVGNAFGELVHLPAGFLLRLCDGRDLRSELGEELGMAIFIFAEAVA